MEQDRISTGDWRRETTRVGRIVGSGVLYAGLGWFIAYRSAALLFLEGVPEIAVADLVSHALHLVAGILAGVGAIVVYHRGRPGIPLILSGVGLATITNMGSALYALVGDPAATALVFTDNHLPRLVPRVLLDLLVLTTLLVDRRSGRDTSPPTRGQQGVHPSA